MANEGKTTDAGTKGGTLRVCRHPAEWVQVASVYPAAGAKKQKAYAKAMCRKCGTEIMRCVK